MQKSVDETVIVSDIIDNISSNYSETRYLDALASIFAVKCKCAAISASGDLAFNSNTQNPSAGMAKIELIQDSLEKLNINNKDTVNWLLALYVCLNINFRRQLELYSIYELDNINELSGLRESVNGLCEWILQQKSKIELHYETSPDDKKIPKNLSDEILKCHSLYEKVLQNDNLWYIPKSLILRPLQDVIKISKMKLEENFRLKVTVLEMSNNNIKRDHAEIKVMKALQERTLTNQETNHSNEISQSDTIHTTVSNISGENKVKYIGISKLCCFSCYEQLQKGTFSCRGTHGLVFQPQKSEKYNILSEKYKQNLKDKNETMCIKKRLSQQQRKLSTDKDYETEELLSLKSKHYT